MSSTKKSAKTDINAIPSTQEYCVIAPVKHGSVNASLAGARSYNVLALIPELVVDSKNGHNTYMYERRGNNDPRSKILRNEEGPWRHTDAFVSCSKDWKPRAQEGA